jgi:predicted AAA+ superfamily ATPase
MGDTPVVAIQGPRQCGKTTLARLVGSSKPYVTLDDSLALDQALRNPKAFLSAYPDGAILDEVQRAPSLFRSLKADVDKDRRPGKWLVTGSANVMVLPKLSESLAGRMEVVSLWPLAAQEISGGSNFVDQLFSADRGFEPNSFNWDSLLKGGFPEPLHRASEHRRRAWFEAYLKALIERDIRDIADIEGLAALPRLLRRLAGEVGDTLNLSSASRETGIPHTTLTRYISLLEAVFLLWPVPSWESGLSHRTIKAARLSFVDSGLHAFLLGLTEARVTAEPELGWRALLNFATMELRKQASWSSVRPGVFHFRSIRRYEVPLLLEAPDGRIIGLCVTEESAASPADFEALRFLESLAEDRFVFGAVLHLGDEVQVVSDRLGAVPLGSLGG